MDSRTAMAMEPCYPCADIHMSESEFEWPEITEEEIKMQNDREDWDPTYAQTHQYIAPCLMPQPSPIPSYIACDLSAGITEPNSEFTWPEITADTDMSTLRLIHKKIWQYVVDHNRKPNTPYINGCALCRYAYLMNEKSINSMCDKCPAVWGDGGFCYASTSLFSRWSNESDPDKRREYAEAIRDISFKSDLEVTDPPSATESDMVNHPRHYNNGSIECIDAIKSATTDLKGIEAVLTGNALKYIWRWKWKNGVEDLKKAIFYINRLIKEVESNGGEET